MIELRQMFQILLAGLAVAFGCVFLFNHTMAFGFAAIVAVIILVFMLRFKVSIGVQEGLKSSNARYPNLPKRLRRAALLSFVTAQVLLIAMFVRRFSLGISPDAEPAIPLAFAVLTLLTVIIMIVSVFLSRPRAIGR